MLSTSLGSKSSPSADCHATISSCGHLRGSISPVNSAVWECSVSAYSAPSSMLSTFHSTVVACNSERGTIMSHILPAATINYSVSHFLSRPSTLVSGKGSRKWGHLGGQHWIGLGRVLRGLHFLALLHCSTAPRLRDEGELGTRAVQYGRRFCGMEAQGS